MADDGWVKAIVVLDDLIESLQVKVPKAIIDKALPPAVTTLNKMSNELMRPLLPDGVASGTRALQSAKTRERFPYHMRDRVRYKLVKDAFGVLGISGVDKYARHVNFDFGEKGRTTGRKHILWGKRPATPPLRIQRKELQNIPEQVAAVLQQRQEGIITAEIIKALQNVT